MSHLNPQLHINVLLTKLFKKIIILPVHQFIMKPLLINLAVPHIKYIKKKLTMSGKIMQEKWGRTFE